MVVPRKPILTIFCKIWFGQNLQHFLRLNLPFAFLFQTRLSFGLRSLSWLTSELRNYFGRSCRLRSDFEGLLRCSSFFKLIIYSNDRQLLAIGRFCSLVSREEFKSIDLLLLVSCLFSLLNPIRVFLYFVSYHLGLISILENC